MAELKKKGSHGAGKLHASVNAFDKFKTKRNLLFFKNSWLFPILS